jgi:uncharacterized protein with von Willebrand factor type A (vWA) domain
LSAPGAGRGVDGGAGVPDGAGAGQRSGTAADGNGHDLVSHLARFSEALRGRNVPVSLREEIDAARALELIDIGDIDEVYTALRATLRIGPRDATIFNLLFDLMWRRSGGSRGPDPPPDPKARKDPASFQIRRGIEALAGALDEEEPEHERGDHAGYSPHALLRQKSFDECTDEDLVAMQRLLDRIAAQLATRRTRRLVPSAKGRIVDLRRSFRGALGTGGELAELAHRRRAVELPHIVLLCDTSGSMDAYSRFLLTFMFSLRRIARQCEAFAFNTRLTRLTPWIAPGNVLRTLERLASRVEDWSGGTRIGACLMEFVEHYMDAFVRSDTVVVILSDGLDRGDTELLQAAMAQIRRRARRVIWLNPLMGDPRYRPEAKGMKAALEYIDHLVPAHNLESLEALLPLLAA